MSNIILPGRHFIERVKSGLGSIKEKLVGSPIPIIEPQGLTIEIGRSIKQPIDMNGLRERILSNKEFMYGLKHMKDGLRLRGVFQCDHYRNGILIGGGLPENPNTFTTEGMARLLNIMFGDVSKAASRIWYVGIFKNNVTPAQANTAAAALGAAGTYGECQDADYDDPATNKPSYVIATTSTAGCTNAASKAEFVMADAITVYGAFLSTEAAKTATTGYLMCAKKFSAARAVVADDELYVTYALSLTTS